MKIALCFRFAQPFDYKLSRGAISSNYREKFKGLKSIELKDTQRGLFHYRVKFLPRPLRGKPQTPKARANGTRFARVFSKAKAHSN